MVLFLQNVKSIQDAIRDADTSEDTAAGARDHRKQGSSPLSGPQAGLSSLKASQQINVISLHHPSGYVPNQLLALQLRVASSAETPVSVHRLNAWLLYAEELAAHSSQGKETVC
jgi:hypothetical protein